VPSEARHGPAAPQSLNLSLFRGCVRGPGTRPCAPIKIPGSVYDPSSPPITKQPSLAPE